MFSTNSPYVKHKVGMRWSESLMGSKGTKDLDKEEHDHINSKSKQGSKCWKQMLVNRKSSKSTIEGTFGHNRGGKKPKEQTRMSKTEQTSPRTGRNIRSEGRTQTCCTTQSRITSAETTGFFTLESLNA
jgi:hypothetical protein